MITILSLLACSGGDATSTPAPAPEPTKTAPEPKYVGLFEPLPEVAKHPTIERTPELVNLGRMLYYENRVSKNHDLSCNSCHLLDRYGQDGEPTSPGHKGVRGSRNSPTTYNAALHVAQFWDGREPDVEAQAKGPVLNPVEMAMADDKMVLTTLNSIPGYGDAFKAAFPGQADPITYDNFGIAIGAFERGLITRGRFDAYLEGDGSVLTEDEVAGMDLFVKTGCVTCHMGPLVGGSQFQKLGVMKPYETKDNGRMEFTKQESDRGYFKVPSLRNVAKTAPYFHDGSIKTMPEAVKIMADVQLNKQLTDEEIAKIVTFLEALTGDLPPADYIAKPELPASGPTTRKADPT